MQIEHIKTSDLIPYARNAKLHSEQQIGKIAGSIKEFGFNNPVLIDAENGIIAGHGRVQAAQVLKLETVPCIRLGHLTETQRRAYILADNRLAEIGGGWDDAMLGIEIGELVGLDVDMSMIGFDEDMLAELLSEANEGIGDPDETPEPPADPVTVLGDVWVLGNHRIVCGDCTDIRTVERALDGVQPHLMVTDPPYGVEYDASWRDKASGKKGETGTAKGKVLNDDRADWRDAWSLFTGEVEYIWHADVFSPTVAESLKACDFELRALICWAKSSLVMSRGHYHHQHEPCWYAVRKGGTGHWAGDRKQTTLWEISKPQKSETGHSTQKPVECMKRPIENNSKPGDHVYEPFSGSGTTIIAGEMTGRHIHAIELNPVYVDMAVTRWQNFTGKQAVHEASGKTFDEMKK